MRFFRSNRKLNISYNKIVKYIKYFVGEIFLIVFGILLALNIDRCNEDKSFEKQKITYVQAFVNDLKRDLGMLENYKELVVKDTLYISNIVKRTKSPEANFDTLLHIYLNEFETKLYTIQGFHDNSLKTMTYTGNNEIFTKPLCNMNSVVNLKILKKR